jgi:hypothetical protein
MSTFEFSSPWNGEVRLPLNRPQTSRETATSDVTYARGNAVHTSLPLASKLAFDAKLIEIELTKPVPAVPAHDKSIILGTAMTKGEAGAATVRAYHKNRFASVYEERLGAMRGLASGLKSNFDAVVGMEERLSSIADSIPVYLEDSSPGKPWTWPARLAVAFLLLFSCFMIVVGVNTNALVLINSALAGFENPIRAYLFSMVAVGVAVGLKFLPRFILKPEDRRVYAIWVWGVGLVLGGLWATFFSITFPGMTTDPTALATSLAANNGSAQTTGQGAWWLILSGMLAEAFLSAGCWLTVELIAKDYKSSSQVPNPAHAKVMEQRNRPAVPSYAEWGLRGRLAW